MSWYAETEPGVPGAIRARIFERGVGETLSSGTGATGAAVAHCHDGPAGGGRARSPSRSTAASSQVEVAEDLRVDLTGWARPVFAGEISDEFEKELHETE